MATGVLSGSLRFLALSLVFAGAARATEQIFPATYLSETMPKGALEAEQTITYREGKSQGTYGLFQTRTEIEYGITSRWLASVYVNAYSVKAHDDSEVTGGGAATVGAYVPNSSRLPIPSAHYQKTGFDSVSLETIHGFLSPYTDAVGLSGYLEYTYGEHIQEIEAKALLQKNFLDDRLILAANLAVELERNSYSLTGAEKDTEIEFTSGASWRIARHWRTGLEIRNIQGYSGYSATSANHEYSVWYGGPMVSFSAHRFFAMLGYQRQLPWAESFNHGAQIEEVAGLNYADHEKHFVRLKFGMTFR